MRTVTATEIAELENEGHEIRHGDKEALEIAGMGELAEALTALAVAQQTASRLQGEVIMALQKSINRPISINGPRDPNAPQLEAILTRLEQAVGSRDDKDNPVYTFTFESDPRGVTHKVIATPSPAPTRPGPY